MYFFFPRDSFNLIIQRNKILLVDLTKTYKKQIVCSLNSALINDRDLLVWVFFFFGFFFRKTSWYELVLNKSFCYKIVFLNLVVFKIMQLIISLHFYWTQKDCGLHVNQNKCKLKVIDFRLTHVHVIIFHKKKKKWWKCNGNINCIILNIIEF